MSKGQPVHGTTAARRDATGWRGVLILGPSGAGKSDLALRLAGAGWRLVSDDYSHLWASGGALYAAAPERIRGRIEVRGLGVVPAAPRLVSRIVLAVECRPDEVVERMPEMAVFDWEGIAIPLLRLNPRPASAVHVVASALDAL